MPSVVLDDPAVRCEPRSLPGVYGQRLAMDQGSRPRGSSLGAPAHKVAGKGGGSLGSLMFRTRKLGNRSQKTLGLTRGMGYQPASADVFVKETPLAVASGQCHSHASVECDRVCHTAGSIPHAHNQLNPRLSGTGRVTLFNAKNNFQCAATRSRVSLIGRLPALFFLVSRAQLSSSS